MDNFLKFDLLLKNLFIYIVNEKVQNVFAHFFFFFYIFHLEFTAF
jgi:hypothetical protein